MSAFPLFKKLKRPTAEKSQKSSESPKSDEASSAPTSQTRVVEGVHKRGGLVSVLVRPHVTEKASRLGQTGTYVFIVDRGATKPEIKRSVEDKYGVKVRSVRVLNFAGKPIQWRGRRASRPGFRKALVTLREGEKIEIT